MKSLQKLLAILMCLILVHSLAACQTKPADSATTPSDKTPESSSTQPNNPTALEIYDKAKAALESASALEMTVTATEVKTFADERYEQTTIQTVTLTGRDTDRFEGYVTETVTQGDTAFTSEEYYDGSTVYLDFEDALYCSDMAQEDYLSRLLPAALLDSTLYEKVYAEGNTLTFSNPTAGEDWAIYETAVLTDAVGTATISTDGALTSTSYTASYRYGAVGMEISVKADITVPENADLSAKAPADPASYANLKFIDAPKMVELAFAVVNDTNNVVSSRTESMDSDFSGSYVYTEASVSTYGSGENLMAKMETDYEYGDANGDTLTEHDSLLLRDGVWSDNTLTPAQMKELYINHLTYGLPHGKDLKSAKITDAGALYLLEMKGSDAYAQATYEALCLALFGESTYYLDDLASEYTNRKMEITLSIDKYTGYPVFFSFHFEGWHTIDGEKYSVCYDMETNYDLGSNEAYKTITGEDPPDVEPENKATPLFYHVTGANGEELWLLGTIHIGDDRTAYLPSEIVDAFNTADALAVEFDILAFEEQLKTDKKLQTQIGLYCTYINGTTVKDHVDKEVYEATVAACKAMGIYDENLMRMKAGILESYISEYPRRYLPEYHTEKGVDYRFLLLAKEQNKTILNVENGLDQMKMFATCSKKLQEYLLMGALSSDPAEYHDGTKELYEAWCSGDEALMRQLVANDTSDLTEEERPLYEEYLKIMETDRNALMLQKAIAYMESGDVVFYAVGAAHVMAEDGLVNTLRDAGYTVELVTYAA